MMKSATASLLVFAFVTVSLALPVTAQQQVPAKEISTAKSNVAAPDFNEVFAKETSRLKADSAVFDPVKTDRENANQQAQKKGWSKTKKTLVIAAIIAGIAVGTYFLIKYAKKCIRYEDDCDPFYDEFCQCEEYEQRNR